MIIGNPQLFAIQWDLVPSWNSTLGFSNGLIQFFVCGLPVNKKKVRAEEIGTQLSQLVRLCDVHKNQRPLPSDVASKSHREIFNWLSETTFPRVDIGQDDCWDFLAAPSSVTDAGNVLFLIKTEKAERLYAGNLDTGFDNFVDLPLKQFEEMALSSELLFRMATQASI